MPAAQGHQVLLGGRLARVDDVVALQQIQCLLYRSAPVTMMVLTASPLLEHAGRAQRGGQPLRGRVAAGDGLDARGLVGHFPVGQRQHGGCLGALDHDHAVGVAHHQVARVHRRTAAGDGVIDATGHELGRTCRIEAGAEHRKAQLQQLELVADRAIHDHAAKACLLAGAEHQRTHQGRSLVSLAVDDQDIAGLGQGDGGVDHQVVSGAHLDGEGRAGELHVLMHGRHACVHGAAAACHVGQDGGLEARGLLDDLGADALDVTDDF
jgi:hypothetical protein